MEIIALNKSQGKEITAHKIFKQLIGISRESFKGSAIHYTRTRTTLPIPFGRTIFTNNLRNSQSRLIDRISQLFENLATSPTPNISRIIYISLSLT